MLYRVLILFIVLLCFERDWAEFIQDASDAVIENLREIEDEYKFGNPKYFVQNQY